MSYALTYQLEESPSATKTLVFLHGFLGNREEWASIWPAFFPHFHCLMIDLPGHGENEPLESSEAYSIEKTAQRVIFLLEQLNRKESILVGYSMGGRLALYLALYFPKYWTQVILESASPGLKNENERQQRRLYDEELAQQLETESFDSFLEKWYKLPLFAPTRSHPLFALLFQQRLKNNPNELAKSLRFMGTGTQPSLWERLDHLKVPALLLVGEYDTKFCQIASEMILVCPRFKMEVVPKVGHNLHFEDSHGFVKSLWNFFI